MKNKKNLLELHTLSLQNFATFTNQEVSFTKGLNAIVGETGSGKSLLMEALALVLGERADKKVVRSGHEFAIIEARFHLQGYETSKFLDDLGHPADGDEVVIKRIIYAEGKSKNFLNLNQCSLQTLQIFTREFVDLVGQFENQRLLSSPYQLDLLDEYIGNEKLRKNYNEIFLKYNELKAHKQKLQEQEKSRLQQIDFLKFQISEIEELSPTTEDENRLVELKKGLLNSELREKTLSQIQDIFVGTSECPGLNMLSSQVCHLARKSNSILHDELQSKIQNLGYLISEIEHDVAVFQAQKIPEDDINTVVDKLDKYQKLKRKHGTVVEDIIKKMEEFKTELAQLELQEEEYGDIESELEKQKISLEKLAREMSLTRKNGVITLSKEITKNIQSLNMKGALVNIEIYELEDFNAQGKDGLRFLVQTNPGEGTHLLQDVASGGELSRILLCLRQLSSSSGKISIFLFDEVDTGIGGETALLLGQHLSDLSKKIQVLAITHLPQIAFNADSLIKVEKEISKEKNIQRTVSKVTHFHSKHQVMKQAENMSVLKLL